MSQGIHTLDSPRVLAKGAQLLLEHRQIGYVLFQKYVGLCIVLIPCTIIFVIAVFLNRPFSGVFRECDSGCGALIKRLSNIPVFFPVLKIYLSNCKHN